MSLTEQRLVDRVNELEEKVRLLQENQLTILRALKSSEKSASSLLGAILATNKKVDALAKIMGLPTFDEE